MPLVGCRRKFIQGPLEKVADIRTLQKVKLSCQSTATAKPISQEEIQREQQTVWVTYERSEREVAESVNWTGEDEWQVQNYDAGSDFICYPSEMIQDEVYYQWPAFKIVQEDLEKDSEITEESWMQSDSFSR